MVMRTGVIYALIWIFWTNHRDGHAGMNDPVIVAVDGGGTQCRAAIFDAGGRRLGYARGAFANLVTDFRESSRHVCEAIDAACRDAGIADLQDRKSVAVLGIAGAEIEDRAAQLEKAIDLPTVRVVSDRDTAIAGVLGERDGMLAQIGTGSFFARRRNGQLSHAGGWGLTLGDECSGAWLGRQLLRSVLMAHDGLLASSVLCEQIESRFGNGPDGIVIFAATATPADFADLAPILFDAFDAGDGLARHVVSAGVADLERILTAMQGDGGSDLFITGGVGARYKPLITPPFRKALKEPDGDSLSGAFAIGAALLKG